MIIRWEKAAILPQYKVQPPQRAMMISAIPMSSPGVSGPTITFLAMAMIATRMMVST